MSGQPTVFDPKNSPKQERQYREKNVLKREAPFQEEQDTNSRTFQLPTKFKSTDEEVTVKQTFEKQLKKRKETSDGDGLNKKPKHSLLQELKSLKPLQPSEKVESILNSQSLREKYARLLSPQHQLPIGFEHQQLIEKMKTIDRTMEFLLKNRRGKNMFFSELKKNIGKSAHTNIKIDHIQQILYLKQDAYRIFWEKNDSKNKYEIMIALPVDFQQQVPHRYNELRMTILDFLKIKQKQFVMGHLTSQKGQKNIFSHIWHKDFNYQRVIIPEMTLPPNPENRGAQIRTMSYQQISSIKDPKLSSIFDKKKEQSEVKSISSIDVKDMIFSKVSGKRIGQEISLIVKQTQIQRQQKKKEEKEETQKLDKELLLKICEQVLFLYNAKSVSSIFSVNLQDNLLQKLRFTRVMIYQAILAITKADKIGFLTEKQTSDGKKVMIICKKKFTDMRKHIIDMFPA